MKKTLREVLNAIAFFLLLHAINFAFVRVGSNLMIKHGINIYPHFHLISDFFSGILNILIIDIVPSVIGLILFQFFRKEKKRAFFTFLSALLALYPVFSILLSIWYSAFCYFCDIHGHDITAHRFMGLTVQLLVLLYAIIPVYIVSRNYAKSQVIWNIVIFLFSLYCYAFFFGGYYFLYFKPINLPF